MRINHLAGLAAYIPAWVAADSDGQKCLSNNGCLGAVKSIKTAKDDCLSFVRPVIVTPAARKSTTTITITSTVGTLTTSLNLTASTTSTILDALDFNGYEPPFGSFGQVRALEERKPAPTLANSKSMPTYATPRCSSFAAYSSACSCLGISRVTTTTAAETSTRTLTSTRTVANTTIFANHSRLLGKNTTIESGWNATSLSLWQSDGSVASVYVATSNTLSQSHPAEWKTASTSSAVHVLSITTLLTITTAPWTNSSSLMAQSFNNSPSSTATSILRNNTTALWRNASSPVSLANATRPMWLNSSIPTLGTNATTGRWLNTTRMPLLPTNTTGFRWLNSTMLPNATTVRWLNSSATIPIQTATLDTSCGETAVPFALQVSQQDGMFHGWYVRVSGNGLLFTSARSSASSFSVESSGHLCAVGHLDREDRPYIAAVGIRDSSSDVWLVRTERLEQLNQDYAPVSCTKDGSLSCAANGTRPASHWLGCGLQLDLSSHGSGEVSVKGRNCTSLELNVISDSQ